MMFDDGVDGAHEVSHQRGLTRGFDLGWSYKGRFDRQIIKDLIDEYDSKSPRDTYAINILKVALKRLKDHTNNREFIT